MSVLSRISNSEGGSVFLDSGGNVYIEGKYYIVRDKHLSIGNRDISVPKNDIMRVGRRKYSAAAILIRTCVLFFLSGVVYKLLGAVKQGSGQIKDAADKVSDAADKISGFYESEIVSSVGGAAGKVSSFFSNLYLVILIAAILLFVLSAFSLVKYLLSHKRLFEVNTAYGFFCISLKGVNRSDVESFISAFYNFRPQAPAPPPPAPESPQSVWYCTKCGAQNNDMYCFKCGQKRQ